MFESPENLLLFLTSDFPLIFSQRDSYPDYDGLCQRIFGTLFPDSIFQEMNLTFGLVQKYGNTECRAFIFPNVFKNIEEDFDQVTNYHLVILKKHILGWKVAATGHRCPTCFGLATTLGNDRPVCPSCGGFGWNFYKSDGLEISLP